MVTISLQRYNFSLNFQLSTLNFFVYYLVVCELIRNFAATETNDKLIKERQIFMKNGKTCFGVIIGTRAYFNSELAKDVRKQLLKTLDEGGYEYVILPEDATPTGSSSIETREDGLKVSKQFRAHRDEIDGIIVSLPNFGFEIGIINAISDADLNVPVLVQA